MLTESHLADVKRNNLNLLRFLLAITVIYSHSFLLSPVRMDSLLMLASHKQTYEGELAVNGFFVLSGFLVTMSWLRKPHLGEFLKRRILRIYPGFLIAFFLSVVVVGAVGAENIKDYLAAFPVGSFVKRWLTLGKATLLPTFLTQQEPGQVNGSLWTIRIEFECYLLVPLVAWFGILRRRSIAVCLMGSVVILHLITPVMIAYGVPIPAFVEYQGRFVAYFLIGMVAYLYKEQLRYTTPGAIVATLALALTSAFGGLHFAMPIAWPYLLLYIGFHPRLRWHEFGKRFDISYGMYLYGWPAKRIILLLFPVISPYPLFLLATLLAMPLALLSWYVIEEPFLRMKGRSPVAGGGDERSDRTSLETPVVVSQRPPTEVI